MRHFDFTTRWIAAAVLAGAALGPAAADDWPAWRGPLGSGASAEKAPVTSWSPDGENLLWSAAVGGRSTPIVMNGRVFVIGPDGEGETLGERIVCFDAESGKVLWERKYGVYFTDIVETRVGWTSLAGDPETGNVYGHLTGGELVCLNRDGKPLWSYSLTEELGRMSGYGGRLMSPFVAGNSVYISMLCSIWGDQARLSHRLIALDKATGAIQFIATPGGQPMDTTYATPIVAPVGSMTQIIAPDPDGWVYGQSPLTGKVLWKFHCSAKAMNSSPVFDGRLAFFTHSEENLSGTVMGRVCALELGRRGDLTEGGAKWNVEGVRAGYCSPAVANGRLYVVTNNADLHCFDAATGKQHWMFELGRVGKGSPLVTADGVIYVGEVNGQFYILKDAGDKCELLHRHEFPRGRGVLHDIYGSPALANGRVYFMTRYHTYCLGRKGAAPERPAGSTAAAMAITGGDAGLRVEPAYVLLKPGGGVKLAAKLFADGGEVKTVQPTYELKGLKGQISPDGALTVGSEAQFAAGTIIARADGQEATVRVRVAPDGPFREDFESYAADGVPPGWIGVSGGKTRIVEKDGSKVLMKQASRERPAPAFLRVMMFPTAPQPIGYTVSADLLGTPKGERSLPDMGLLNARYELTLMGKSQELRLATWSSIPRLQKDVKFEWKPDTWYRAKFEVKLDGTRAVARGKVWPRGEAEPSAWQIELVDERPNLEGSPGLYGFSPGTTPSSDGEEIYYDNIEVTNE